MAEIIPDDYTDNVELLNELREWISERIDRAEPPRMAFILLTEAAYILELYVLSKERIPELVDAAIRLGRRWGQKEMENE